MFTGIIEESGKITEISLNGNNRTFTIKSNLASMLKVDESVSHNGICLTIESISGNTYTVTAIHETLVKTNAGSWNPGDTLNLERAMKMNGRLDGHLVQGHVDGTALCSHKKDEGGSTVFTFTFDQQFAALVIEKGSICVNGVSLTAFNVTENSFSVAIIPYTIEHTNLKFLSENSIVNIEYDILGKYVQRMINLSAH